MNDKKGLFIVLEGGEGVGKSTNMAFMQQYLQQRGIHFEHSREPGGTVIAEKIRALILEKQSEPMAAMTEILLVFAARAQHLAEKILPLIAKNNWVLCDRFTDATYAYQGAGRGLDCSLIEQLEQMVQGSLRPDCTIILDAPVAVGRARATARAELDRMESEAISFHQRVRDAYLARAAANADKYAVIDASKSLPEVQEQLQKVLDTLITRWQQHG